MSQKTFRETSEQLAWLETQSVEQLAVWIANALSGFPKPVEFYGHISESYSELAVLFSNAGAALRQKLAHAIQRLVSRKEYDRSPATLGKVLCLVDQLHWPELRPHLVALAEQDAFRGCNVGVLPSRYVPDVLRDLAASLA